MLVTCWEAHIDGYGWQYVDPEDAAMVHVCRPGNVRLVRVQVPRVARFEHWRIKPQPPEAPSNRRLAAANKALATQRERAGLFAGHLEQPSPQERIAHFDSSHNQSVLERRIEEARDRRAVRRELAVFPASAYALAMLRWSGWRGPRDAKFLRYIMKKAIADTCTTTSDASPSSSPTQTASSLGSSPTRTDPGTRPGADPS